MAETQATVAAWADVTFGEAHSMALVAVRANKEMTELLEKAVAFDQHCSGETASACAEECADVVIILMRLCRNVGCDLLEEIEKKMAINRARKWKLDGFGHGYHVK